jgi:hypothetical protein
MGRAGRRGGAVRERRAAGTGDPRRAVPRGALASLLLTCLLVLMCASGASAVVVRLPGGRFLSYQPVPGAPITPGPLDSVFHNLDFNGGSVMSSSTNYTFYWDPSGAPVYPSDYQPGLDTFFEDLAHDSGGSENVDSVSTQYNGAAGEFANYDSHFGGAIIDTNPYPANGCELSGVSICLADYQIRAELRSYLKSHGLPMDLLHEYFVLLPPGVESCFGASNAFCSAGTLKHERESFCAYHGAERLGAGEGVIVYAEDPFAAGGICDDANHPNGTTADATISGGLSHEHNESLTDPEPNRTWTDWATGASTGYEIGDKCRTFSEGTEFGTPLGTAPDGAKYNQVINGHEYWYQQEWSNEGHECLQRLAPGGERPAARYTFTSGEAEASFDASTSTAPGGVAYYDWQLNEFEGETPRETSSPLFSWGNTKGVFRVALTVFAPGGASSGTVHVVNIGNIDVPSVTKVSPVKGPAAGGAKVTILGTNFNEAEASVKFGALNAVSFAVASPTKIIAVSPPSTAGSVDVTVTTYYGRSATSSLDRYKFAPPVIKRLSPNSGSTAGGLGVTVAGSGFQPGTGTTVFRFGIGHATGVSCSSSSLCTLTTPSATVTGTIDVIVTAGGISSIRTPGDHFTYN